MPREYYSQLEQGKAKQTPPQNAIGLVALGLAFNLFAFIFAFSINEITFALFFSSSFLFLDIVILLIMSVLVISKRWNRFPKLFVSLELSGYILLTYSPVAMAVSLFTDNGINAVFIVLLLMLIPVGSAFQILVVRKIKQAVADGKYLPDGDGLFTKATLRKYMPYISIITAVLEGSRMSVVIWTRLTARFWGNMAMAMVLPFFAIILVLGFSILAATTYMDFFCLSIFPDWATSKDLV